MPSTPFAVASINAETQGAPLALSFNLALAGVPYNSFNLNITGPNINLAVLESQIQIATDFIRTWRRMIQSDVEQFTPQILNKWR